VKPAVAGQKLRSGSDSDHNAITNYSTLVRMMECSSCRSVSWMNTKWPGPGKPVSSLIQSFHRKKVNPHQSFLTARQSRVSIAGLVSRGWCDCQLEGLALAQDRDS